MSDSNNTTKDPNFLGSGTYGCAYDPPIQCEDGETPENTISKVMKGNNAKREFKEYDIVRDTDPEGIYTIGALRMCKPELSNKKLQDYLKETCTPIQKSKLDDLSMLLLENGGMDLDRYIREVFNKMTNQQERALETKRLFVRFMDILNGADLFTMNEVSHRDIKLQNVVFNKDTGRTKFIDFGIMITKPDFISSSVSGVNELAKSWEYFPKEYSCGNYNAFKTEKCNKYNKNMSYDNFIKKVSDTFDMYCLCYALHAFFSTVEENEIVFKECNETEKNNILSLCKKLRLLLRKYYY